MPSRVPGNEEGMPQADDRRDACVPESRGRARNPSVWRRPDASQKPRHAARARLWPSHAHRVHQLSRAHELASREHRRHRMGLRAQGGLADPGRGVAGAALRGRPLPFPEGQVREPQQCWPLLLGSWELHDLC